MVVTFSFPSRRRVLRRTLLPLFLSTVAFVFLFHITLPLDSPVRLGIYFQIHRAQLLLHGSGISRDAYLWRDYQSQPPFPINWDTDVGVVVKTGYGTRKRLSAVVEGIGFNPNVSNTNKEGFVVVSDWTPDETPNTPTLLGADGKEVDWSYGAGVKIEVVDALGLMLKRVGQRMGDIPRFRAYKDLLAAIDDGDVEKAWSVSHQHGWELDVSKFLVGLELIYTQHPPKKWYIIIDDDSYLIKPSLLLLLSHLDYREEYYLGNAVGDFKGRFAHGGSGVIFSRPAVQKLLSRPDVLAEANILALSETWGDKLVATTFQKVGVYLDERYSHHFNGERPRITRIYPDKFCSPLVSFHGVNDQDEMRKISGALGRLKNPMLWGHLWPLYGLPEISTLDDGYYHVDQDHVGRGDEASMHIDGLDTPEECRAKCNSRYSSWCVAWTWDQRGGCHMAPWMIIGEKPHGLISGINVPKVKKLARYC